MDGYEGDGFYCQEIDPCQKNNGNCSPHAICTYLEPVKLIVLLYFLVSTTRDVIPKRAIKLSWLEPWLPVEGEPKTG